MPGCYYKWGPEAKALWKSKKAIWRFIRKGKADESIQGNSGDPAGDPNTNILDGISKGKGNVGGGLASRGLIFEPEIDEAHRNQEK